MPRGCAPTSSSTRGLIHSQRVLLALTEAGLGRQEAYAIVQRHAMRAWQDGVPLLELLRADPEVTARISTRRRSPRCSISTITSGTSIGSSRGCSAPLRRS